MSGFPDLISLLPPAEAGTRVTDQRLGYWTGQAPGTVARQRQRAGIPPQSVFSLLQQTRLDWGIEAPPIALRPIPKTEGLVAKPRPTRLTLPQTDLVLSAFAQMPDPERLARRYLLPTALIQACVLEGAALEHADCYAGHQLSSVIDRWSQAIMPGRARNTPGTAYCKEGLAVRQRLERWEQRLACSSDTEKSAMVAGLAAWRSACHTGRGDWLFLQHGALTDFLTVMGLLGVATEDFRPVVKASAQLIKDLNQAGFVNLACVTADHHTARALRNGGVILRIIRKGDNHHRSQSSMARALCALTTNLAVTV